MCRSVTSFRPRHVIVWYHSEEYEPNHDSAWFLFNNVYSTFSACDKATDLVVARHEEALAVSETISAAVSRLPPSFISISSTSACFQVFLGVGCLVVLVSFAVVIPMVWGVDTLRSKILDLFMDVPVVVVRKLKTMARNQLDDLEAELEDDDDMRREAATTVGDGIEEGVSRDLSYDIVGFPGAILSSRLLSAQELGKSAIDAG